MGKKAQGAQTHHYVPKFVLRNFCAYPEKEQVNVFAKDDSRNFPTSIDNIMAERRFNDFLVDEEFYATYEPAISDLESAVLPRYQRVLDERQLCHTADEKAELGLLIAFQFLRTRSQRNWFLQMERHLAEMAERMGARPEDIEGYSPLTEGGLTIQHNEFMKDALPQFANIIASKDFALLAAPEDRTFYLGDNPVALHNSIPSPSPLYGNIGIGLPGIEIYLPLSYDLLLAAWCPSIASNHRESVAELDRMLATIMLSPVAWNHNDPAQKAMLEKARGQRAEAKNRIDAIENGKPIPLIDENMDFHNSMALAFARHFVVCRDSDFELARRWMNDNPGHTGNMIKFG
ncbi:MAG: DUF4238 domain-containing protein [Rhodobacteraceae bacterium]|nr:DUF4238 domain-containing protein [Paracoccaceae bacterium]